MFIDNDDVRLQLLPKQDNGLSAGQDLLPLQDGLEQRLHFLTNSNTVKSYQCKKRYHTLNSFVKCYQLEDCRITVRNSDFTDGSPLTTRSCDFLCSKCVVSKVALPESERYPQCCHCLKYLYCGCDANLALLSLFIFH